MTCCIRPIRPARTALAGACLAALTTLAAAPAAAEVSLSGVFRDPTGTVVATDSIDVWLTLTASGDEPLSFDTNASAPFGLPASLLPLTGSNYAQQLYDQPFGSYTGAYLFTYRYCDDSFEGCGPGGAYASSVPSSPDVWFSVTMPFSLAPGASQDFLIYRLSPVGGAAAPGTYSLFNVGVGVGVQGLALDGVTPLEALAFESAPPCGGGTAEACSFTRTVTAIPEPASLLLMLGGLGVVAGWTGRRRSTATAVNAG